MRFSLDDLKKVESSSVAAVAQTTATVVQAIIKVNRADYVPKNVQVRAAISPHLFTGEFKQSDLPAIENDAGVESISISRPLNLAK